MRAAVLTGPAAMEIMEVPEPEITKAGQIKIRVLVCGLCNSEVERYTGECLSEGQIIGHEPVGIVVERGAEVTDFQVGDRVAAGFCHHAFAEYAVQDAGLFARVPDGIPDEEAIAEPPSCMLGVANRVPVRIGDRVAVIGCGYMGLLLLQFLKLRGCAKLTAVDTRREALVRALAHGADEVYTPQELRPEHFVEGINEWAFLDGFDHVFEVTGGETGLGLASRMVKAHGCLAIVGYHTSVRAVQMKLWNIKGLNVINAHDKRMDCRGDYVRRLMTMTEAGKFSSRGLITHPFPIERIGEGFKTMIGRPEGYIKGYIRVCES